MLKVYAEMHTLLFLSHSFPVCVGMLVPACLPACLSACLSACGVTGGIAVGALYWQVESLVVQ